MLKRLNAFKLRMILMTIGTEIAGLKTALATLDAKVSAIGTPVASTVDLTPVTGAIAAVDAKVTDVQNSLVVPA